MSGPDTSKTLYICPKCFWVCDTESKCHQHQLILACEPGEFGDERRRPVRNQFGLFVSRAPRWYLEAVGWIRTK
jgi:hypothetical protein